MLAPHQFNDIDVDVTFLRNGTPMASITFQVSLMFSPSKIQISTVNTDYSLWDHYRLYAVTKIYYCE